MSFLLYQGMRISAQRRYEGEGRILKIPKWCQVIYATVTQGYKVIWVALSQVAILRSEYRWPSYYDY